MLQFCHFMFRKLFTILYKKNFKYFSNKSLSRLQEEVK